MRDDPSIAVLGLGAMGRTLAATLLQDERSTTVWNRTPGKDGKLRADGAATAASVAAAVRESGLVVVCLLDYASVRATLEPVAADLVGRAVLNLTSTTPDEARGLARWAAEHDITYLDGAIMAVPTMIGRPGASLLYSGDLETYDTNREVLELFGGTEYLGTDPGLASLYDFALLAGMYAMFAGFAHGAAMLRSAGVSAESFAVRAVPWLAAMTHSLPGQGRTIDSGNYDTEVQSLRFNRAALDAIVRASRAVDVGVEIIRPVKALIDEQIADGHGEQAFARIVEGIAVRR